MKNKIDNVVIVAGGLNTRMKDLSVFPKILFPMPDYSSILTYDIETFEDKKVYLVINEKYYDMVVNYVDRNNLKLADIIKSTNTDGSANTLKEVKDKLPKKNTLLVWSDLIIESFGILESLLKLTEKDHVIFTQAGEYRFKAFDAKDYKGDRVGIKPIVKPDPDASFAECGNVPGIYFYKEKPDLESIPEDFHNYDYLEYVADFFGYDAETCAVGSNLIEFRDKEKFKEYYTKEREEISIPRFFNTIEIDREKKTLKKTCKNKEYTHLILKEANWYGNVKKIGFKGIPDVKDSSSKFEDDESGKATYASISMELLDGYMTASEYARDHSQKEIKAMVEKIIARAEELHATKKPVEFIDVQEDYEEEFINKVIRRCDSIKHMLINYDRDKLLRLLKKACDILYHKKCKVGFMPNTSYSLIHGDLNGSNVMYNPESGDVKFIDPRGYFGMTKVYGPEDYDFAKILYFISGYDSFNKGKAIYNDWKFEEVLDTWNIPHKLMWWDYWVILGIIWIALAQYIGQDIMKANLAYEHGMKILEEELENSENEEELENSENQGHIE